MSTKRFVHPPSDPKKWAQICLGIIRHYNEGWARGFRYGIQYFEIWNEPENRPAMWTGTDEQFLELYRAAAAEIKRVYPSLKVGGPGFGYTGKFEHKTFDPSDFLLKFLRYCRKESVPLDFLSWHCYTADLGDLIERTKAMREVLDREGFEKTENHLTEWNYLPDNSWASFSKSAPARDRRAFYERMSGSEGAAFLVAGLIALQDAPLDVSCIFHGEVGAFGLFNEFGGPTACWEGIRFFSSLAQAQFRKVAVSSGPEQFPIAAVTDSANTFLILVSNCDKTSRAIRIRMQGFGQHSPKTFNIARVPTTVPAETSVNLNDGHISIVLAASTLALLEAALSGKDN